MNVRLTPEERFELFGKFDPGTHGAEIEERWGDTDQFREARRRTTRYTRADWQQMVAESTAINARLAASMQSGLPATSVQAMDAAEAHRDHISRWFYDCPHEMHRGLAEMYVADERFGAVYEAVAPGLTLYMRDAALANADRHST